MGQGPARLTPQQHEFTAAWRNQPKWVVARALKSVGPNTTPVSEDIEAVIRRPQAQLSGQIDIRGTILAQSLIEPGLIDKYRLGFRPRQIVSISLPVAKCNRPILVLHRRA